MTVKLLTSLRGYGGACRNGGNAVLPAELGGFSLSRVFRQIDRAVVHPVGQVLRQAAPFLLAPVTGGYSLLVGGVGHGGGGPAADAPSQGPEIGIVDAPPNPSTGYPLVPSAPGPTSQNFLPAPSPAPAPAPSYDTSGGGGGGGGGGVVYGPPAPVQSPAWLLPVLVAGGAALLFFSRRRR